MKKFFSIKVFLLLGFDLLIVPVGIFCKWLSGVMLDGIESECMWTCFGGKCLTCGGTHFVNYLLDGKIVQAFNENHFLFLCLIILIVVFVLLHLYLLFKIQFAKKMLRCIFSIPSLIIFMTIIVIVILVRNIPTAITIFGLLKTRFL